MPGLTVKAPKLVSLASVGLRVLATPLSTSLRRVDHLPQHANAVHARVVLSVIATDPHGHPTDGDAEPLEVHGDLDLLRVLRSVDVVAEAGDADPGLVEGERAGVRRLLGVGVEAAEQGPELVDEPVAAAGAGAGDVVAIASDFTLGVFGEGTGSVAAGGGVGGPDAVGVVLAADLGPELDPLGRAADVGGSLRRDVFDDRMGRVDGLWHDQRELRARGSRKRERARVSDTAVLVKPDPVGRHLGLQVGVERRSRAFLGAPALASLSPGDDGFNRPARGVPLEEPAEPLCRSEPGQPLELLLASVEALAGHWCGVGGEDGVDDGAPVEGEVVDVVEAEVVVVWGVGQLVRRLAQGRRWRSPGQLGPQRLVEVAVEPVVERRRGRRGSSIPTARHDLVPEVREGVVGGGEGGDQPHDRHQDAEHRPRAGGAVRTSGLANGDHWACRPLTDGNDRRGEVDKLFLLFANRRETHRLSTRQHGQTVSNSETSESLPPRAGQRSQRQSLLTPRQQRSSQLWRLRPCRHMRWMFWVPGHPSSCCRCCRQRSLHDCPHDGRQRQERD